MNIIFHNGLVNFDYKQLQQVQIIQKRNRRNKTQCSLYYANKNKMLFICVRTFPLPRYNTYTATRLRNRSRLKIQASLAAGGQRGRGEWSLVTFRIHDVTHAPIVCNITLIGIVIIRTYRYLAGYVIVVQQFRLWLPNQP